MNTLLADIITGLKKPRTGWTLQQRGIPEKIRETVLEHVKKVVKAARIFITSGLISDFENTK